MIDPVACPKCGRPSVPVYELDVPHGQEGRRMGALHLAAHDCPCGGDHMLLQAGIPAPTEGDAP